jgi:predicted dehydrogenase
MGAWGRDWMSVTAAAPDVAPVAYVDPAPPARAATVAQGVSPEFVFGDLASAIEASEPEAALVTAPVPVHAALAAEALDAGLPVLLEKPFAPTLADAVRIVRLAAAADRTLMISQNYRHHPAPRLVAAVVADGVVGEVVGVEVDFRRHRIATPDVLARHQGIDHPLLLDMAIHHFDLMRLVLGREATRVSMEPIHPVSSAYRDPPAAYGTLLFEDDLPVSYRASWISHARRTPWGGEWRIEGTHGALEWRSRGDPGVRDVVRLRTAGRGPRVLPLSGVAELDRAGTLAAFVQAVRTGSEPETSGRRNLATLALTLASIRSATERRVVDVAELTAEIPGDLR